MRRVIKIKKKYVIIVFFIVLIVWGIIVNIFYSENIKFINLNNDVKKNVSESVDIVGNVYYVSADGCSSDGTVMSDPMSLETANKKRFTSKDKILFRKNDVFYGQVNLNIEKVNDSMAYVGAYGEGELPIISGAKIFQNSSKCEKIAENIYKINLNEADYGIVGDNQINEVGFIAVDNKKIYGNVVKKYDLLKNDMDFYCENNNIYIVCDTNPIIKFGKLIFATRIDLFRVSNNCEVENLKFMYTGSNVLVKRNYPINNVYIHNCVIDTNGGSKSNTSTENEIARYGNGIEFWCGASNVIIENNYLNNIYDAGITLQGSGGEFNNIIIRNNIIVNTCYSFELWASDKSLGMNNIKIYNNYSINEGKGWGQSVRPNPYNSANFVFYGFGNNAEMDINIYNNHLFNSTRLYYVLYSIKDRFKSEIYIDNNYYFNDEELKYYVNDIKSDNAKSYLGTEYNIEKNSIFRELSDSELKKVNNEAILSSNDYNEIKSYYDNLELEFKYIDLENELIEKYGELENNLTNENVVAGITNLKVMIQNFKDGKIILTQDDVKDLINYHYATVANLGVGNGEGLVFIVEKLNEFVDTYSKLCELTGFDIEYDKEEINARIQNNKKLIKENADLNTDVINGLMDIIINYNSNIDNSIDEIVTVKLLDVIENYMNNIMNNRDIKIVFSTTDLTNEDVVATLETDAPIELEGSNQYTFTENGSFTFKYTLNGEEKEITAVVGWIDKDVPVISGIDEREDDMDQVTLNVTDANLDSISLKKDGQDVSFNNGDVLIEVGEYVVIATDLAGNKAERSFKIVDYIESNKTYYISLNGTGDGLSGENPMNVKDINKTRFYSGDKILFKSGEKYSIDIDCIRKGSPDNRVVISNYGDGELPIINGSILLMSNVDISNLKFTNGSESCLVTNYDFCENVKIENCIFDEVNDTAIYLNRQVSNIEITNCIFKNCKSTAIVMKNDNNGFEADKVSINNNVFIDIAKSIEIGSENLDNVFSEIEISKNYFVGQTGSEAIININKIVPDKFEVYIYSNLFYGFDNAYKVITEDENIKKFLVCDYNAFYRYSESNIFNDIKNTADLINSYDNENGSKVVFISKEKYEVEKCLESVSTLNSVDEIVEFLSTDVKAHEGEKQLRSYGRTDELIINKVLTADEMKKLNMKVMTDSTVADEKLPLAGWQKVSIAGILIIAVTGLFSAIKYAKFKKDTRKQIRRK